MCIKAYTCIYIHRHTHMYIDTYTRNAQNDKMLNIHVCTHTHIYVHVNTYTYTYMPCMYAHTHTHRALLTIVPCLSHIHTCIHTSTRSSWFISLCMYVRTYVCIIDFLPNFPMQVSFYPFLCSLCFLSFVSNSIQFMQQISRCYIVYPFLCSSCILSQVQTIEGRETAFNSF